MARGECLTKHHYWFPRKKYPDKFHRSKHIWLKKSIHAAFHAHFHRRCRLPKDRACFKGFCRYCGVCCYYQSHELSY